MKMEFRMNRLSRLLFCFALLPLFFVPVSCDKEEEQVEQAYMTGTVDFDLPAYMIKGETVTLTAYGITEPEEVVYKWRITDMFTDTLQTNPITIQLPLKISGQLTVTALALADGYYQSSRTKTVTMVDTALMTSLKNVSLAGRRFVDQRDGKLYRYRTIGNLDWFIQNLAYDDHGRYGAAYENSPATQTFFGRYYSWDEATLGESSSGLGCGPQGLCPDGWSVPTNEDWEDFALALSGEALPFSDIWEGLGEKASVGATFNDERLWKYSPDNAHTNSSGWNALPLGNTQYNHKSFLGVNEYAFFWSASERSDTQAYYRYIYFDQGSFPANYAGKSGFGANVRCVRLAQEQ